MSTLKGKLPAGIVKDVQQLRKELETDKTMTEMELNIKMKEINDVLRCMKEYKSLINKRKERQYALNFNLKTDNFDNGRKIKNG